jgi:hypothetical protein
MDWNMTKPPLGAKINFAHPLAKGIVGCWLLNEGMGDKVYDLSGNGNTGTLANFSHPATVTSGWNPGKFGKTLLHNAILQTKINCGANAVFGITNSISLIAYIKTVSNTQESIIIKANSYYLETNISTGKVGVYLVGASSGWLNSNKTINDNNLHLIVAT